MKEYYQHNLPRYRRETIGFALFLGWMYCSLFGCGLATHDSAIDGTLTTYNLEHIWLMSGLFEALGGAAGFVVAHIFHSPEYLVKRRAFGASALVFALVGNVLTWLAWTDRFGQIWMLHLPGGALTGISVALFAILWSDRLRSYDEAHVEFAIPLSFTIAFTLYSVLLFTKRGSIPFLALLIIMIAGSFWLACRGESAKRVAAPEMQRRVPPHHGLTSFGTLACISWVQVAFFRVIATPDIMGSRMNHFLIPFACACVLSLFMLILCLRMSRYLNISLAYRWSLPMFTLSYIPILIDYNNPSLRLVAYSINFLGMFGVQFGCWLGACKYMRRARCAALDVFGMYALGEGLGIFLGCLAGLFAVKTLDTQGIIVLSAALMTIVVFAVMVTGFNPNWVFSRTRPRGAQLDEARASTSDEFDLDLLFEQEASTLQNAYGLTNRETDVAALLLAGRSRPFIRDELVVSINTVSSHVRSIFSKCGVHSQQELMNLARGGGSVRTVAPCEKPRQPR